MNTICDQSIVHNCGAEMQLPAYGIC